MAVPVNTLDAFCTAIPFAAAGPKGSAKVNEHSLTNVRSIMRWAIGDITSRIALTPVAKTTLSGTL
jgi:hypothetical protein